MTFCRQCDKNVATYWELDYCEKNPEGLISEPTEHGNKINGVITCEDGYCNPRQAIIDDNTLTTKGYIRTHEVHQRCEECDQFMESMG